MNNPLRKNFRTPTSQYRPISNDIFYKWTKTDPSLQLLDIYPMTSKDEINTKNPDLLISGKSTALLIQSCVPQIVDVWSIPSIDIDPLLIAIRIATYGSKMEITNKCSHCDHENTNDLDLAQYVSSIQIPDYSKGINLDNGLIVFLRPLTYKESSDLAMEMLEIKKSMEQIELMEDQEKQQEYLSLYLDKSLEVSFKTLAYATDCIKTPDEVVSEKEYIYEFYENSSKLVIDKIKDQIDENSKLIEFKPISIKCQSCEKDNNVIVNFDYSSFFDSRS